MTPEFAYFMKVNVAFALFYAFYRLFFYKDTFFKLRRTILLAFFVLALGYPLMNFQEWVQEQEPIQGVVLLYSSILPEVVVESSINETINWAAFFRSAFVYLYIGVVFVLLIRFFFQLGSILWLAHVCKRESMLGTSVLLLDRPAGPFSFFRLIFVHPASHSSGEMEEILAHENTHVKEWHSVDVMICELVSIICWINPFVWLLKREVRHNLEYLADNYVLQAGYDSKCYQYHLLGLAHHQVAVNLYNNFNVLHLKNRISMMNKKRSHGIGRTKYLAFIPLAALLMLCSNIEAVARVTRELAKQAVFPSPKSDKKIKIRAIVVDDFDQPLSGVSVTIEGTSMGTSTDIDGAFALEVSEDAYLICSVLGMEQKKVSVKQVNKDKKIKMETEKQSPAFTIVDEMPDFPGGQIALMAFINKNVRYPVSAQENGIEGRVTCSFIVEKDGNISNLNVTKGVDPLLDHAAMDVIKLMPKWIPGKSKGIPVPVKYTVPITFHLTGAESSLPEVPAQASKTELYTDKGQTTDSESQLFTIVEEMPRFPGGQSALMSYVAKSLRYPIAAQERGIQGRVTCSFIVDKDGTIIQPGIERSLDPDLDKEALRIVANMPKWIPGKQRGHAVKVRYTMPVTFVLN